jgi:hypothetical protein
MARTAVETAKVLTLMYEESFGGDELEMFRIHWPELRSLAGQAKLTEHYLAGINKALAKAEYVLVPLEDFLVVAMQTNFNHTRQVPPRLLEQSLQDEDFEWDEVADEEDDEDD